jgi:hypothetical protein
LDRRDYLTRTAAACGWSLGSLRRQLNENYLPLEFLLAHDEELEMLAERDSDGAPRPAPVGGLLPRRRASPALLPGATFDGRLT